MSTAGLRISRRQALGLAAGGALGAAGLRLAIAPRPGGTAAGASAAGAGGAWISPLGDARPAAAHLLRRAGLGYGDADLDDAARLSYGDLVDRLLAQRPDPLPMPTDPSDHRAVVTAWYAHMATTRAPLPERMTLFWHGVLTSDYRKANRLPFVYQQNQLFRTRGLGDLRTLLVETTYDPLMMRYLDLDRSVARSPNENYSRELMELFTLGVGNYSESDVREAARALSGIRIRAYDAQGTVVALGPAGKDAAQRQELYAQSAQLIGAGGRFRGDLEPHQHDAGAKTVLGRTGNLGPEDVIEAILAHPATASFLARKVLVAFVGPQPDAALVSRIADGFRSSRYDITEMLRAVFTSDEFLSSSSYRALVRSPADFMVAAMRATGRTDLAAAAALAGQDMDQVLYDPPTVAGWPSNGAWLSSSALLARLNFAQTVAGRAGSLPDPVQGARSQLDGVVGADTAAVFNAGHSDGDRWYAILASPEFSLK